MEYCFDPKHEEPCPLPCFACEEECNPKYMDAQLAEEDE